MTRRADQDNQLKSLQRRAARGVMLDPANRPFKIESFTHDQGKEFLVAEVERLARVAIVRAARDVQRHPKRRADATHILEKLSEIEKASRWLRAQDAVELAQSLAPNDNNGPLPTSHLTQIIESLHHVADWNSDLRQNYRVPAARANNAAHLARHFVDLMGGLFTRVTGKTPRKSKTSQFERFLRAAWDDLGFPVLADSTLSVLAENYQSRSRK